MLQSIAYENTNSNPASSVDLEWTFDDGTFGNQGIEQGGDPATGILTVGILDVPNTAPTTTPVTLVPIAEDSGAIVITAADLLANASDVDNDILTVSGLALSSSTSSTGTLVDNGDGTWTFTPALNEDSEARFNFTISDGTEDVAGTATLDIAPVNDAPMGADNEITIDEDTPYTLSLIHI